MVAIYAKAKAAAESLYEGRCTVFVQAKSVNPDHKRIEFTETELFRDRPCRLSFTTAPITSEVDHATRLTQGVKLFLSPECMIPAGSKIVVIQNGVTGVYANSGEPAIYVTHQEIPLELFQEWS